MLLRILLAATLFALAVGCNKATSEKSDEDKGKGPSLYELGDD